MLQFDEVAFSCFENDHQIYQIKTMLRHCWPALPGWVEDVYVCGPHHRASNSSSMASCRADAPYASLSIYIGSEFFSNQTREQLNAILHEISHCYNSPVRDAAEIFLPEGATQRESVNKWLEFCNSHLTRKFWNMLELERKWKDIEIECLGQPITQS